MLVVGVVTLMMSEKEMKTEKEMSEKEMKTENELASDRLPLLTSVGQQKMELRQNASEQHIWVECFDCLMRLLTREPLRKLVSLMWYLKI